MRQREGDPIVYPGQHGQHVDAVLASLDLKLILVVLKALDNTALVSSNGIETVLFVAADLCQKEGVEKKQTAN
jgi:hypothetical protein